MEKSNDKRCDLFNIKMWEFEILLEPWELGVLLRKEKISDEVDVMLENLLNWYVGEEKYDYACILRDEIYRRNRIKKTAK